MIAAALLECARRDGSATRDGIRVAHLGRVSLTGPWSVTGDSRRVQICDDEVAAIRAIEALLVEQQRGTQTHEDSWRPL